VLKKSMNLQLHIPIQKRVTVKSLPCHGYGKPSGWDVFRED